MFLNCIIFFLQEAHAHLLKLGQDSMPNPIFRASSTTSTSSTHIPPPPLLLQCTDTSMLFCPAPFVHSGGQIVAYYTLHARCFVGSNVKVRLADNHFTGLGIEVLHIIYQIEKGTGLDLGVLSNG